MAPGEMAPLTPAPSTADERAAARLAPTRVERIRPYLPEGTELHGVSLLATTDTPQGPLDALLVRKRLEGGVVATVLVLDARDALVAELPRARAGGPDTLRVGSLLVPLADRATLEALDRGDVDLDTADAVLRLAKLVVRDRLLTAADQGWSAFDENPDPDVLLLGVAPQMSPRRREGAPLGRPLGGCPRVLRWAEPSPRRWKAGARSTGPGRPRPRRGQGRGRGLRLCWSSASRDACRADGRRARRPQVGVWRQPGDGPWRANATSRPSRGWSERM